MSEKHNKLETLKLNEVNSSSIKKLQSRFTIKPSRTKLANLAIELGLAKIKPS